MVDALRASQGPWSDGVTLIVSDDHRHLVAAARRHLQGVAWQRCQTHFITNILDATPNALKSEIKFRVREIFEAATPESARRLLQAVVDDYAERAPGAIACLEAGFDDATAVLVLPKPCRNRLRTASNASTRKSAGANGSSASSPTNSPPYA